MGMSANARIAWGVDLAEDEYGDLTEETRERLSALLDDDWDLDKLFGFAEDSPDRPASLESVPRGERVGHPDYQAWHAELDAWGERRRAAVPVEIGYYGTIDYAGKALLVKRSYTSVNWGCDAVDPATLTPPTEAEVAALNKVLDAIGFTGDRAPRLLLFAMYG